MSNIVSTQPRNSKVKYRSFTFGHQSYIDAAEKEAQILTRNAQYRTYEYAATLSIDDYLTIAQHRDFWKRFGVGLRGKGLAIYWVREWDDLWCGDLGTPTRLHYHLIIAEDPTPKKPLPSMRFWNKNPNNHMEGGWQFLDPDQLEPAPADPIPEQSEPAPTDTPEQPLPSMRFWDKNPNNQVEGGWEMLVPPAQSEVSLMNPETVKTIIRQAIPKGVRTRLHVSVIDNVVNWSRYVLKAKTRGEYRGQHSEDKHQGKRMVWPKCGLNKVGTVGNFLEKSKADLWGEVIQATKQTRTTKQTTEQDKTTEIGGINMPFGVRSLAVSQLSSGGQLKFSDNCDSVARMFRNSQGVQDDQDQDTGLFRDTERFLAGSGDGGIRYLADRQGKRVQTLPVLVADV